MAKGFKHGGSGGTSLNFKVVINPQPETAKENTIWVNTDVPIPKRYFSATQPENMAEGEVWFSTGTSSPVAFSATKKNPVMVYPLGAKQYVDGALVDVTAESYQNGEWVVWWSGELFTDGNTWDAITGGWVGDSNLVIESRAYKSAGEVTEDALVLSISTADKSENITTANSIDLTNFSYLAFTVTNWGNSGTGFGFFYKDGATSFTSRVTISANGNYTLAVPAGGGEYRVGFGVSTSGSTRSFRVTEARLMR